MTKIAAEAMTAEGVTSTTSQPFTGTTPWPMAASRPSGAGRTARWPKHW